MKRTIFYIGNFSFPDRNAAGKRVFGTCKLLQAMGYHVVCIGRGDGTDLQSEGILCHAFSIGNLGRILSGNIKKVLIYIEQQMRLGSVESVVLYGAIFTQMENIAIAKWCHARGISVYYDHVDWFEPDWTTPLKATIRLYNHFLLHHKLFADCDGIICISQYLSDYHQSHGRKTVIIPPLSAVQKIASSDSVRNGPMRFVYSGTSADKARPPQQWKDRLDIMFAQLAKASENPDIRPFIFDIYGLTKEQYLQMFPKRLRQSGMDVLNRLGDRVVFHGLIPNTQAMEAVSNADFSVLVRDRKRATMAGFPTKVSESLACGTPVICTDTSDLKDYIRDGENGFICNTEDLAGVFEMVLNFSDMKLSEMRKNCSNNVFYYANFQEEMRAFRKD